MQHVKPSHGHGQAYEKGLADSELCLAPRGSRVWSPRLFEMIWFGCIPVPCCKLLIWRYLEISGDGTAISMFLKSVSSCGNCVLRRLGRSVFEEYTWIFIVSAIIFVITDMKQIWWNSEPQLWCRPARLEVIISSGQLGYIQSGSPVGCWLTMKSGLPCPIWLLMIDT